MNALGTWSDRGPTGITYNAHIILIVELFIEKGQKSPGFLLGAASGQTHL